MSKLDDYIEPFEKVIWKGKPDKKAFVIPAFGGIPIGLTFLSIALYFFLIGVPNSWPLLFFIPIFIGAFLVFPPIYFLKKYSNTEYVLTDQRLIIKSGLTKRFAFLSIFNRFFPGRKTWIAEIGEIKDLIVKKGRIVDKIFGTASIYPITPDYPYFPKNYPMPSSRDPGMARRIYEVANLVTEKYEEVPLYLLWEKTFYRPRMDALKKPYEIEKLLEAKIYSKKLEKEKSTSNERIRNYCSNCGTKIAYEDFFCRNCGKKL